MWGAGRGGERASTKRVLAFSVEGDTLIIIITIMILAAPRESLKLLGIDHVVPAAGPLRNVAALVF